MTQEELDVILSGTPNEIVKGLQISTVSVPKWSDLKKEYDPMLHKIMDPQLYPIKKDDNGQDEFKRTTFALQKLACHRMAQSMFAEAVKRIYTYDADNASEAAAVGLFEELYRTRTKIDSINIERAKRLNASCQVVSVWTVYEKPTQIGTEISKFTLKCSVYSEMDDYTIYPITDKNGDVLVISIAWKDNSNKDWMSTYINNVKDNTGRYILWQKLEEWNAVEDDKLDIFPALYLNMKEPVWGGEAGTNKVEQLEEMESFQGLYIRRNASPTFTMDFGKTPPGSKRKKTTTEKSDDARRVIEVGEGGKMVDVTWEGATDAVAARYDRIKSAYFEEIQMPDTSFANMIKSNTSAENKELIFADARAKAKDLGGEWEESFRDEIVIIKKMASVMFPSIAKALETISIRSEIQPYNVRTKLETAEYIQTAGDSMSLPTKVALLGEVDDRAQEVEAIEEEQGVNNNQLG